MSPDSGIAQANADDIVKALRELKPNPKQQKHDLFTELYPVIVERLEAKVSQKEILGLLAKHGLKLHPAKFKQLMAIEAKKAIAITQPHHEEIQA